MRQAPVLISAAAVLVLVGVVPTMMGAQQSATAVTSLVFDGVTVVDVEQGKLVPAQRVVITGNRIEAVGGAGAVTMPKRAQVVDARGKYLIPGLWDMHIHPARSINLFYPLFIANGVTGIRDAGSMVPLDTLLLLRREILAGRHIGPPRQILSGQSIMGPLGNCDRHQRQLESRFQTCIANSADARRVVDSLKAAGADMIKPRAVTREMYFVIAAEARRVGVPFGGHGEHETVIEASDSGASLIDHLRLEKGWPGPMGFHELCVDRQSASVEQCQAVAERLRRNGTWIVADVRPQYETSWFNQRMREFLDGSLLSGNWLRNPASATPDSVGLMHMIQRVGVPILAGTDVSGRQDFRSNSWWDLPPGFSLHAELARLVTEGLTSLNALRATTLNPAKMLHGTDSLGSVAPGKLADLVLLDADPLVDITNTTTIRAVVANGRYFDRTALDALLIEVQSKVKEP